MRPVAAPSVRVRGAAIVLPACRRGRMDSYTPGIRVQPALFLSERPCSQSQKIERQGFPESLKGIWARLN